MDDKALPNVGLDLLQTLAVLLEQKNVSSAAAVLDVSQPSMSQRLKRLRSIFRDPLLVPSRNGLRLTPRAAELQERLRDVLDAVAAMLGPDAASGANGSGRRLRIALPEFGIPPFARAAVRQLVRRQLPSVEVELLRVPEPTLGQIAQGGADICISYDTLSPVPPGFSRQFLLTDSFVFAVRPGHWLCERAASIQDLGEVAHVSMSAAKSIERQVEQTLGTFGLRRNVAREASCYCAAAETCAGSDFALAIPGHFAAYLDVTSMVLLPPLPHLRHGLAISMIWRTTLSSDPAIAAIRAALTTFASEQVQVVGGPERQGPRPPSRGNDEPTGRYAG